MSSVPHPRRRSQRTSPAKSGMLTLVSDRCSLDIPPDAHTIEGFRKWATAEDFPEHVRVTFVDGNIIVDMSNQEINSHVAVKTEMCRVIATLAKEQSMGVYYGSGALLTNEAARFSDNPDALFLSEETLHSERVRYVPWRGNGKKCCELEGTPDWVLQIRCDSSVHKDTIGLSEAYHRAGVPEYWFVDGRKKRPSFHILLRRKNGYIAVPSRDGWQRSKVFSRSFKLERTVDDYGLWDFTLHVRED